ncbi:MAG: peptide chain release factor N(5)-glutamine methyltransferase [Gemmatimonadota bacterium]
MVGWTVLTLVRTTTEFFQKRGIPAPRLSAEYLLADVLECRRLDLYLDFDRPLSAGELNAYREHVRRRSAHEPIEYITGETSFRDLELAVDPRVLIPRSETEQLVDEVLEWARAGSRCGRAPSGGWRLVDVGTGSGAIACALAQELDGLDWILGVDSSPGAIAVARGNAERNHVQRTRWLVADGLVALDAGLRVDAIVANPPYLANDERALLETQVVDWEPETALFAGPRGDEALAVLVTSAAEHLRPAGLLALEVGAGQADGVRAMIAASAGLEHLSTYRDHNGIERGVLALAD